MLKNFDHVTIVVHDLDAAKKFFTLLGFRVDKEVVIAGEPFATYMGVPGIEADHVTLVLEGVEPRTEVQLLRYHRPPATPDPHIRDLHKLGLNHVCFAVTDLDGIVARLQAAGIRLRNQVMDFHQRRLVFVYGPEDITIELAEWH